VRPVRTLYCHQTFRQELYFRCILNALKSETAVSGGRCRLSYFTPYGHFTAFSEPHAVLAYVAEETALHGSPGYHPRLATMFWGVDSMRKAVDGPLYVAREVLNEEKHGGAWALAAVRSGPIPPHLHPLEIVTVEGGPSVLAVVCESTWASPCLVIDDDEVRDLLDSWFDSLVRQGIVLNPLHGQICNPVDQGEFKRRISSGVASEPVCFFPPIFEYARTDDDWETTLLKMKIDVSTDLMETLETLCSAPGAHVHFGLPLDVADEILSRVVSRLGSHGASVSLKLVARAADDVSVLCRPPLAEVPPHVALRLVVGDCFPFPIAVGVAGSGFTGMSCYYGDASLTFLTRNATFGEKLVAQGGLGVDHPACIPVPQNHTQREELCNQLLRDQDRWFLSSIPIELQRFGRLFTTDIHLHDESTRLVVQRAKEQFEKIRSILMEIVDERDT